MQLVKPSIHKEIRQSVMAAMETGNQRRARTVLTEYREQYPTEAENLRLDVIASYGVAL